MSRKPFANFEVPASMLLSLRATTSAPPALEATMVASEHAFPEGVSTSTTSKLLAAKSNTLAKDWRPRSSDGFGGSDPANQQGQARDITDCP